MLLKNFGIKKSLSVPEKSPQSLSESQRKDWGMQRPVLHWNSSSLNKILKMSNKAVSSVGAADPDFYTASGSRSDHRTGKKGQIFFLFNIFSKGA
jgi:hypothetical protein